MICLITSITAVATITEASIGTVLRPPADGDYDPPPVRGTGSRRTGTGGSRAGRDGCPRGQEGYPV